MNQRFLDIYFDTEFVCFKSLEPLSIGLVSFSDENLGAYFERTDVDKALTKFSQPDKAFLSGDVVPQLGNMELHKALQSRGVALQAGYLPQISKALHSYLAMLSNNAKSRRKSVRLISDFEGDFLVLDRLVDISAQKELGLCYAWLSDVLAQNRRGFPAYHAHKKALFDHPEKFVSGAQFKRHHAYFDAWVMAQAANAESSES